MAASSAKRSDNLALTAILVVGGLLIVELLQVSQPSQQAETLQAAKPATYVAAAHGK